MDFLTLLLGFLLALILYQALSSLSRRNQNLPPGPTPLPLIGNLHLLGDQPHKSLAKLAKKHGPFMALKLGQITTIVVSSSAMAKEVLQKQDLAFSSRSVPDALRAHDHYKYSVIWLPVSSRWRSLRKILNTKIFSANRLDANHHLRCKKVQELIAYCRKNCQTGEAMDVGWAAFRTSLNLLSNTIFSKDFADPLLDASKEAKDLVWKAMMEAGKPNLVDYFPVLEKLDPQGIRKRITFQMRKSMEIFVGLIDERLKQRKGKGAYNDVLDALLTTSEESPQEIDLTHIQRMCMDLFGAGTDTTSSTLEWAMSEMLKNPDKMKKAQAELAQVIGKSKSIEEADIARLPYLRCVIKETLRIHPPTPFLIPRRTVEEVEVFGYKVPKGSQVLVNVWAIGRDEATWAEALAFKPERFLGSEIDMRGQHFELIPFGAGRRICPGLPLAVRMLHVMLGSMLNSFEWKVEGGIAATEMDMEEQFGITLQKAHPLHAVPTPL